MGLIPWAPAMQLLAEIDSPCYKSDDPILVETLKKCNVDMARVVLDVDFVDQKTRIFLA